MVFCNVGLLSSCCCLSSSICCRVKKGFLRLLTGSSGWARDHSSKTSGWRHCTWRRRFFLCLVVKWHISQEKGFSPAETQYHEYRLSIRGGGETWRHNEISTQTPTCVFDGHVWDQELLFGRGIFTVVTPEGPVVGVGELMVEQQLLVFTRIVAKLALEPWKCT